MFLSTWEGLAKTISWRWAGPWGKSLQKHRALHGARYRWRTWVVQSVLTAPNFASHLRYIFNPAQLGAIGSLLICFVIVMTPPQLLFQLFATTGSSSAPERLWLRLAVAPWTASFADLGGRRHLSLASSCTTRRCAGGKSSFSPSP